MSFGSILKRVREGKGWTQGELAERSGLSKAGIANLEQDRVGPTWDSVVALCDALDVSADVFRPAKGQPEPKASPTRRGRPPLKAPVKARKPRG